jgi:bifunctional DNA-binding transcriptional regulator/antitoxin component of YhaV-PrlF toxin-antitoxin module
MFRKECLHYGDPHYFWVKCLESEVEVKKVDSRGRLILPADWRKTEIRESLELYVIKRKGYLKIIPKRRIDLTENFDKVDLGIGSIGIWKEFKEKLHKERT